MTQEEIIEGNKLIAEFMELQKDEESGNYHIVNEPHIHASCLMSIEYLQYHSSWDWLMPVVEKIRDMKNESAEYMTQNSKLASALTTARIWIVYKAIIEFIKWYNINKETI